MSEEKLENLIEALTSATKNRQHLRGQLKHVIETAERLGASESAVQLKAAIGSLKAFESWWRLPNDQRTIESIEPAMRHCLEVIENVEESWIGSLWKLSLPSLDLVFKDLAAKVDIADWQPTTLDEAKLVADEHMRLYGIEYDSDGGSYVSRKLATRSVAKKLLGGKDETEEK